MDELPIYEIFIDLDDNSAFMDYNAIVDRPAHMKKTQVFSEDKPRQYHFDDEKQIVIGVAISADTLIYRKDDELGEYNVVFTKPNISKIVEQYSRDKFWNNVNIEHDKSDSVDGSVMLYSYQIDEEIGMTAPELFKDENDGTWLMGYKIYDKDAYEKAKNGGFSIEGVFYQQLVTMSQRFKEEDLTDEQFNHVMKLLDVFELLQKTTH